MAKGPQGQKRPADAVGAAVMVAKIATGEIEETPKVAISNAAAELGRRGGKARAKRLTPDERSKIAAVAAKSRWGQNKAIPAARGKKEPSE